MKNFFSCIQMMCSYIWKLLRMPPKIGEKAYYWSYRIKDEPEKINLFPYTNNKLSETLRKKFHLHSIKIKQYFGINLTKELRTLMGEVEEDTKKQYNILYSWSRRVNSVKCPCHPKSSTHLMQSLSNSQWHFLQR